MSVAEAAEPKARFYLNKESKICRVVFWPWENFTLCLSERQLGRLGTYAILIKAFFNLSLCYEFLVQVALFFKSLFFMLKWNQHYRLNCLLWKLKKIIENFAKVNTESFTLLQILPPLRGASRDLNENTGVRTIEVVNWKLYHLVVKLERQFSKLFLKW